MNSKRLQRVNALIKREVSQLLLREVEFPQNTLVTITRTGTSDDLKESNVWVSVIPEKEMEKIIVFLNRRIYFLQQKINQRLRMKPIPKIRFLPEEETSEAGRIEEILEKLKSKKSWRI